jgi:hypothetical protein
VIKKLQSLCRNVTPKGCLHTLSMCIYRGSTPSSINQFICLSSNSTTFTFTLTRYHALSPPWDTHAKTSGQKASRNSPSRLSSLIEEARGPHRHHLYARRCCMLISLPTKNKDGILDTLQRKDTEIYINKCIFLPCNQKLHWWSFSHNIKHQRILL